MRVSLTDHATAQYVLRVKPGLDEDTARRELLALINVAGDPVPELPWKPVDTFHGSCFLEISDGIALVLQPKGKHYAATTVITRAADTPLVEKRKAERKRKRASARRSRARALERHQRNRRRAETSGSGWPD